MAVHRVQELIGLMQKNLECSICLELMKSPVATKCEHYFCKFCITEFIDKKRYVPCPLCKQPITRRTLTEKGELNNIVNAVNSIISAFQEDSGHTYCPPSGPQTFFPCTPEAINSRSEAHQSKARKNVRQTHRPSKVASNQEGSDVRESGHSHSSDDGFAVPSVPSTSGLKSSRRRKSPAASTLPTSPSSVASDTEPSGQFRGRSRSKRRAAPSSLDTNDQLLRYLDENSCGLQRESQQEIVPAQQETEAREQGNSKAEQSGHQNSTVQKSKAIGAAVETETQGSQSISRPTSGEAAVAGSKMIRLDEDMQVDENKTVRSAQDTDSLTKQDLANSQDKSHTSDVKLTMESAEMNHEEKVFTKVVEDNIENLETRAQIDKENLSSPRKTSPRKKSNGEQLKTGLTNSSQNSSDDGSISSTQQFLQPLPVVTKTYGRRSGTRSSSNKKVQDWIACLSSGKQTSRQKCPDRDQRMEHKQTKDINESEMDQQSTGQIQGKISKRNVQGRDEGNVVPVTENQKNRNDPSKDIPIQAKGNEASASCVTESLEEFMLTPPVRKKPIFKRRDAKNNKESNSPTLRVEENSPPADPYFFEVGHTPVSMAKKKGRPRSKEKKGKPPTLQPLNLSINEKKIVSFSDVTSTELITKTDSVVEDSTEGLIGPNRISIVPNQGKHIEKPSEFQCSEIDSTNIDVEGTDVSFTPFVRPGTRSRSKAQNKTHVNNKGSSPANKNVSFQKKGRRKASKEKETAEAEKVREEQTQKLASWIGQAEDYDLLFSTQEAQASIEKLQRHEKGHESNKSFDGKDDDSYDGAIALNDEDTDSNDGFCLIGPITNGRSTRNQSAQQNTDFDAIIAEGPSHSDQNVTDNKTALLVNAKGSEITNNEDASLSKNGSVSSQQAQDKFSNTPKTRKQESSTCNLNLSPRSDLSESRSRINTIAETQLSTLTSPGSSGIVLPSPTAESALPKLSTPIIQTARQTRSQRLSPCTGGTAHKDHGNKREPALIDLSPKPRNGKQKEVNVATTCAEASPSFHSVKTLTGDEEPDDSLVPPSFNLASPSNATHAKNMSISPKTTRQTKSKSPKESRKETTDLSTSPDQPESLKRSSNRLKRQKRGSNNSSPMVTTIPSTFTDDLSSEVAVICTNGRGQQEKQNKQTTPPPVSEINTEHPPNSTTEAEEIGKETKATASMVSTTSDTTKARGDGTATNDTREDGIIKHQNTVAENIISTVQNDDDRMCDSDGESGTSSTEDLNIQAAEDEFEEADMTLQPEEVQQKYSSRQYTQDSATSQDHIKESDKFSEGNDSLHKSSGSVKAKAVADKRTQLKSTESEKRNAFKGPEECVKLRKRKHTSTESHTDKNTELSLDSCATLVPESLPLITQIPETLEMEETDSSAKTFSASSGTQKSKKEKRQKDDQSPKLICGSTTDSSCTFEANSLQSDISSPTQSQQTADMQGCPANRLKFKVTSSPKSEGQTSSTSATPSQSILQPVRVEQEFSSGHVRQSEMDTVSPSQHSLHSVASDAGADHIESQLQGQRDGLQASAECLTNLNNLSSASDKPEHPQHASYQTKPQKMDETKESHNCDDNQISVKCLQTESKILVQDSQNPQKVEDQNASVVLEQVILDSLPDCKELNQQHNIANQQSLADDLNTHKEQNVGQSVNTSANCTEQNKSNPLPISQSPEQNCSFSKHTASSPESPLITKDKNLNKPSANLSPSSPVSSSRKRKHSDEISKLDVDPSLQYETPELFPTKSPSIGPRKVISSAPPCTTSLLSDSDDGDAVLIVRRTKRKCFSLEGSPLKALTPLAIKRRRYNRKRKNLSQEFDKQADIDAQLGHKEGKVMLTDEEKDERQPEKDLSTISTTEHSVKSKNVAESDCGNNGSESLTKLEDSEDLMNKKELERNECKTVSEVSPVYSRRKTVRGLARQKAEPHDLDFKISGRQTSPRTHTSTTADSHIQKTAWQNSNDRQVLVKVSEDDDLMEVDDVSISAGSAEMNLLHPNRQKQLETGHSKPDPEESGLIHEEPLVSEIGSGEKPIVITQSSSGNQTQKPLFLTQSLLPGSTDDSTIPPPSFDLGFDEDDVEDREDDQNLVTDAKTTDEMVIDEQNSPFDVDGHAHSILKRQSHKVTQQNVKESGNECKESIEEQDQDVSRGIPVENPAIRNDSEDQNLPRSSNESEKHSTTSEEEVVMMKKKKPAVIASDTDTDSDHESDAGSEASLQLNFTSSSAVSSQSEILNTQERTKMESELDRLRREIAEVEAKLQGQNFSRSDSMGTGDSNKLNKSVLNVKTETKSCQSSDNSSDEEVEEVSAVRNKRRGKASKEKPTARIKRPRRWRVMSSDDEEENKHPRQQLIDAYLSDVKAHSPADGQTSADPANGPLSPLHVSPVVKTEDRVSPLVSDEDSDLFLSPLSPSPPPPIKLSLARTEPSSRSTSLFTVEPPNLTGSRAVARFRQSLDFSDNTMTKDQDRQRTDHDDLYKDNNIQNSPDSNASTSGSLKKIPESQFSVSGGMDDERASQLNRSQQDFCEDVSGGNLFDPSNDDDIESSGSPLPSPLKDKVIDMNEKKEDINKDLDDSEEIDDSDLPRWKRKKFGFISSGLDQEKMGMLRKLAETNECKVYSKFNDSVTHVIVKTDRESRVCERTLKYFQGVAAKCWVLSYDWVVSSMSDGCFVRENEYEIEGDTVKGDDHYGPSRSRLSTSPLLEGCAFASVGVSSDMSKKELTQLLMLTGAEVVEDPWGLATHSAKHKLVLRCVDSESQPPTPAETELFDGQYKHFGLVTVAREWILDSICTHSLQPLSLYVCNTCPNLRLPF